MLRLAAARPTFKTPTPQPQPQSAPQPQTQLSFNSDREDINEGGDVNPSLAKDHTGLGVVGVEGTPTSLPTVSPPATGRAGGTGGTGGGDSNAPSSMDNGSSGSGSGTRGGSSGSGSNNSSAGSANGLTSPLTQPSGGLINKGPGRRGNNTLAPITGTGGSSPVRSISTSSNSSSPAGNENDPLLFLLSHFSSFFPTSNLKMAQKTNGSLLTFLFFSFFCLFLHRFCLFFPFPTRSHFILSLSLPSCHFPLP